MELVDGDRARELEPNLSKEVIGALYCSSAGIVCPFNMTFALIENAKKCKIEDFKSSLSTYLFGIGKFMIFQKLMNLKFLP